MAETSDNSMGSDENIRKVDFITIITLIPSDILLWGCLFNATISCLCAPEFDPGAFRQPILDQLGGEQYGVQFAGTGGSHQ